MTKRLLFGRDIKAQPKTNPPPGRFVPPPELLLKVDAQTRSEIDNLVATASLENPTQHILEVAIVGPHPFLFWPEEPVFRFEPHKKKVDGPIIQRIDVPANSTVVFEARIPWIELCYEDAQSASFSTLFMLAGAQKPGLLHVALPGRRSRDAYFFDGVSVSKAAYEKRLQSLPDHDGYYCELNKGGDGGREGWTAKDASDRSFEYIGTSLKGWHVYEINAVGDTDPNALSK